MASFGTVVTVSERSCSCAGERPGVGLPSPPSAPLASSELAELPLVRLDFSCNRITRIPLCFRRLRHLQCILLENNPLQSPPAQVAVSASGGWRRCPALVASSQNLGPLVLAPAGSSASGGCFSRAEGPGPSCRNAEWLLGPRRAGVGCGRGAF